MHKCIAISNLSMNKKKIFHLSATAADLDVFMDLVNQPSYPLNQRVLCLKELSSECTAHDIRKHFKGSYSLTNFHTILNKIMRKSFRFSKLQVYRSQMFI